jgi:hypothetical protein
MAADASLTKRLQLFMQGDRAAADALLREVLPRLRDIAVRELKRERYVAPLSKTELINELWVSHLSKGGWQIRDQGHFYALASLAMRRVLVDMAERGSPCAGEAEKRRYRLTNPYLSLERQFRRLSKSSKSAF